MSTLTSIEWTDVSWNPVRGCSLVSAGCANCYAMKFAHRFSGAGKPYEGLTELGPQGARWTGKIRLVHELLVDPLRWRDPRRIFVNSMSDLFHEDVPDEFIEKVLTTIVHSPRHCYQVLTKRPERMRDFMQRWTCMNGRPLPNVWLGVSIEDQQTADERIPILLQTPAAVRWVSAEPLLGPVSFRWAKWDNWKDGQGNERPVVNQHDGLRMLDWIVVGGESGPGARPCDLTLIRSIVGQCQAAGVSVFVKQLGSKPEEYVFQNIGYDGEGNIEDDGRMELIKLKNRKGNDPAEWPADLRVRQWPR